MADDTRLGAAGLKLVTVPDREPRDMRFGAGGMKVVSVPAGAVDTRMGNIGLKWVSTPLDPLPPVILVTPIPNGFTVQTTQFRPSAEIPDDEHFSTIITMVDPEDELSVLTFVYEAPDVGLTFAVIDTIGSEVRKFISAVHVGLISGQSVPSNVVDATSLLNGPRANTPTVTITGTTHGPDGSVTAVGSPFTHVEGQVPRDEYDEETNAYPYLLLAQWRILTSAGALVHDHALLPAEDPPDFEYVGLAAGSYRLEVRYFDGHYGVLTLYSPRVPFVIAAAPAVAPGAPTVSVTSCDSVDGVVVASGAYVPPIDLEVQASVRWRARLEGYGAGVVRTTGIQASYHWLGLSPGTWHFDVAHGDVLGRYGAYSAVVGTCTIYPTPVPPIWLVAAGLRIHELTVLPWASGEADAVVVWEYELERSGDRGATWVTLAAWTTGQSFMFSLGGVPDGLYYLRLRKRDPAHDVPSEWASLPVYVDRTQGAVYTRDLTGLTAIPDYMEKAWDDEIEWTPTPDGLHARIVGVRYGGGARRGMMLIKDIGQPVVGQFVTSFAILAYPFTWVGWKYHHLGDLCPGLGYRASGRTSLGTRAGLQTTISCGIHPWPFYAHLHTCCSNGGSVCITEACQEHPAIIGPVCGVPYSCSPPNCPTCGCSACHGETTEQSTSAIYASAREAQSKHIEYGVPSFPSKITQLGYGKGSTFLASSLFETSVPAYTGTRPRGLRVSTRDLNGCRYFYHRYVMIQDVSRVGPGQLRVRTQVLGPGLDPDSGWQHDMTLRMEGHVSGGFIPCGYVGLALDHAFGIGDPATGGPGALFFSFSATGLGYEDCEAPPIPPPGLEPPPIPPGTSEGEGPCIVERRFFFGLIGSDELRLYQDRPTDQ